MGYVPPPLMPIRRRESSVSRHGYYILEGHNVVQIEDVNEWGRFFGSKDRVVAKTDKGEIQVSTVFLGLDHNFGEGPPLLFETMVFGGEHDGDCERCATWNEAEKQHRRMCEIVFGHPNAEEAKHRVFFGD